MGESDTSGKSRPTTAIHLCQECGSSFREGHDVVCLSDGYVEIGEEYEVRNRRFFHAECWVNSEYMDTDS